MQVQSQTAAAAKAVSKLNSFIKSPLYTIDDSISDIPIELKKTLTPHNSENPIMQPGASNPGNSQNPSATVVPHIVVPHFPTITQLVTPQVQTITVPRL